MGSPFNTDPAQIARQRAIFRQFLTDLISDDGILKQDGLWIAPDPAPLTAAEVREMFEDLRTDYRYSRQHFSTRTVDGMAVSMLNGVITTEPEPEDWP